MPVPFNRFRLLNNGNRDVTSAKFKRFSNDPGLPPEAKFVDPGDLTDEEDVTATGPVVQGSAIEHFPMNVGYFTEGAKVFAITSLVVGTGGTARRIDTWELFFPEDLYDPEGNYVTEADLYVQNVPGSNNEYYVTAHLTFFDGTEWDYYSDILHA